MATVSIIIPVYNAEHTLERCVDSVLGQEFTDFELLLVDDGSSDGSPALCDRYAAQDSRVRVIHKENGGVSAARNAAMDLAEGEFLQFLDSDDWITPDATKLLLRSAREHQCDLVIADFYRVVGDRVSHKGGIEEDRVLSQEEFAGHMMENPADFRRHRGVRPAPSAEKVSACACVKEGIHGHGQYHHPGIQRRTHPGALRGQRFGPGVHGL